MRQESFRRRYNLYLVNQAIGWLTRVELGATSHAAIPSIRHAKCQGKAKGQERNHAFRHCHHGKVKKERQREAAFPGLTRQQDRWPISWEIRGGCSSPDGAVS